MSTATTILSSNIRFLRKQKGISQEELARELEIKRSNIAAYESKNVEPRLRIILKIAKFFNVAVKDLVQSKIFEGQEYASFSTSKSDSLSDAASHMSLKNSSEISNFVDKSMKIRQILDGFKAFYVFKRKNIAQEDHAKQKLVYDIDNFIELMEHLMSYNEKVISAVSKVHQN